MKRIKYCDICGKDFYVKSNGKYCSNECKKKMKKIYTKRYRDNHPEKIIKSREKYKENNPDGFQKSREKYNKINPNKVKEWKLRNKGRVSAINRKRELQKKKACPIWLTEFDHDYITHIYIQSRELEKIDNVKYHVDHIIPLQGKNVSGLHVPWNLQILTADENLRKWNKYEES